ncbi:MAG: NADAR family protein [Epsilonproteobacteria bacterium]|nr:NADAR family protein [Campylobacterota bacterium]
MIREFQNEYRWLSNFAPCCIILDNAEYQSVEHAYMSAKSDDKKWKHFCQTEPKASSVKKASTDIVLIHDWTSKRVEIMKQCLYQKYAQEPYKSLLIATKHEFTRR